MADSGWDDSFSPMKGTTHLKLSNRLRTAGFFALLLAPMFASLPGCTEKASLAPSSRAEGETNQPSFGQFAGIPIPGGASLDTEHSLIFGSGEGWFGRLAIGAGLSTSATFDFYKNEMPRFGWQEITSIRSAISILSYQKGERIATIQVQRSSAILGGSQIEFTVSPQGGGMGAPPMPVTPSRAPVSSAPLPTR